MSACGIVTTPSSAFGSVLCVDRNARRCFSACWRGRGQKADGASARCPRVVKGRDGHRVWSVCWVVWRRLSQAGWHGPLPSRQPVPPSVVGSTEQQGTGLGGTHRPGWLAEPAAAFSIFPPKATVAFPHCLFREFEGDLNSHGTYCGGLGKPSSLSYRAG